MSEERNFQLLLDRDVVKFTLQGVPDRPGIAAEIFTILSSAGINVELVIQTASYADVAEISLVIKDEFVFAAEQQLQNLCPDMCARGFYRDDGIGLITLSRKNIFKMPGIAARLFRVIANLSINIELISTSFDCLTCCIRETELSKAYQALVEEFDITQIH
ncbi:ACT domain-containing protein [bacterium]|nr:ACT domain-containing protein [bacterium]